MGSSWRGTIGSPRWAVAVALIASVAFSMASPWPAGATFPGENGVIVFYRFSPLPDRIYTIHPDGTGRTQLTSGANTFDPAWSPSGSRIAYVRNSTSLWTMNADGSNRTHILSRPVGWNLIYLAEPAWAPGGGRIAFCALSPNFRFSKIWVVNTDGSGLKDLSGANRHDCEPAWSPTGSLIASDAALGRSKSKIAVMRPDGSDRRVLVSRGINFYPKWSPDGSRLLFDRQVHGQFDLFVMRRDGSQRVQLTDTPRRQEWMGIFSPDGTRIVFPRSQTGDRFSPNDLWVMNANGTNQHRITHTKHVDEFYPDWRPVS